MRCDRTSDKTCQILSKLPNPKYWLDASHLSGSSYLVVQGRATGKQQAIIEFTSKLLDRPLLKTDLLKTQYSATC
jgi:hypothetical protein